MLVKRIAKMDLRIVSFKVVLQSLKLPEEEKLTPIDILNNSNTVVIDVEPIFVKSRLPTFLFEDHSYLHFLWVYKS